MKIAIICPNYPPASFEGGISHYSYFLAENLAKLGHQVYAITSKDSKLQGKQPEAYRKVNVIRIDESWNNGSVGAIKKIVKERSIESAILQYAPAMYSNSFRVAWALTHFPCQKITSFHTLWGHRWDRFYGIIMLFGCDKIVATNSEIMAIIEKRLPMFLQKTYWIPIGSNIHQYFKDKKTNESNNSLICNFGMLYPGKGIEMILSVMGHLKREKVPYNFKFIGGEIIYHNNFANTLKKQINERKLGTHIEILGHLPSIEVSRWLNNSRLVFLPYDSGLSDRRGTLMAALNHSKAILSSPPVVSLPFFKNNSNIMWPEDSSAEGYAKKIKRLLTDDQLVKRLEIGAKQLFSNFTWDKIASETELVLSQNK